MGATDIRLTEDMYFIESHVLNRIILLNPFTQTSYAVPGCQVLKIKAVRIS